MGDAGRVAIEMNDGSGSIVLEKQGSHRLMARCLYLLAQDAKMVPLLLHTQAVKRDRQGIYGLLESGALVGVALEESSLCHQSL